MIDTPTSKMQIIVLLTFLIAAFLLGAAEGRSAHKKTIILLGDSITDGLAPSVRESLPGWRVINAGVVGDTAAGGSKRIVELMGKYRPDVVTIMFGINDHGTYRYEDYRIYIERIVQAVWDADTRQANTQNRLILMTTSRVHSRLTCESGSLNDHIQARFSWARELSFDRGLENFPTPHYMDDKSFGKDGIHLTAAGNRRVAKALAKFLEEDHRVKN